VRRTYRYDRETRELISLDEWLAKYGNRSTKAHYVQPDLEPYIAVSGDMAGKMIRSRREHRAFLKRNKFEEVGNEKAYMTRHNGMTEDNPNLMPEHKREEQICRSLSKTLDRLRNR
jgi:hypothetical protein